MLVLQRKHYIMSEILNGGNTLKVIPKNGLDNYRVGQTVRVFHEINSQKYREGKITKVRQHAFEFGFSVGTTELPRVIIL